MLRLNCSLPTQFTYYCNENSSKDLKLFSAAISLLNWIWFNIKFKNNSRTYFIITERKFNGNKGSFVNYVTQGRSQEFFEGGSNSSRGDFFLEGVIELSQIWEKLLNSVRKCLIPLYLDRHVIYEWPIKEKALHVSIRRNINQFRMWNWIRNGYTLLSETSMNWIKINYQRGRS